MANLGINPTVDDISADHLDRLRKELTPLLRENHRLLESIMWRLADEMHDAVCAGFTAGENAARDVVPDEMI